MQQVSTLLLLKTVSPIPTWPDEDYSVPDTVTLLAGMTSVTFNVTITDDDIFETDEIFQLAINQSSLPIYITAIHPYQASVVIIDDETGNKDDLVLIHYSYNHTVT